MASPGTQDTTARPAGDAAVIDGAPHDVGSTGYQPPSPTQPSSDHGAAGPWPRWIGSMDMPGMDDDGMVD
jgi:hypothetical protein